MKNEKIDEKSKWINLCAFSLLQLSNNIPFAYLTPIWTQACTFYNVSSNDLLWTSNLFYITFLLQLVFIRYIHAHIENAIRISSIINLAGCWLMYIQDTYQLLLVAYGLIGVSSAFVFSMPIHIAQKWFRIDQQILAACIGLISSFIGADFGQFFSYIYFNDLDDGQVFQEKLKTFNLIIAIVGTISSVTCLFIRNQPKEYRKFRLMKQFKQVLRQDILIDAFSFGICKILSYKDIGMNWNFATQMASQLFIFNYTYTQLGNIYAGFIFGGLFSTFVTAYRLDQYSSSNDQPNYDFYLKSMVFIGLIPLIIVTLFTQYLNAGVILFFNILIGVSQYAMIPVALQSFAEKYFPMPALFLDSIVNQIANVTSLFIQYLSIQKVLVNYPLLFILVMITPIQLYVFILYRTKYKRFELAN